MSTSIRNEIKQNILVSTPLIASWLIISLSTFVSTVFVARLGQDALGATVLMNSIWILVQVFFYGMFNVLSVLVSQNFGAGSYSEVGKIVRHGVLLAFAMSIIAMSFMAITPLFLHYVINDVHVIGIAKSYMFSLLWAVPTMAILVALENLYNGIGKTHISLIISLLEVPIEIVLIYIFVFGKLGLPAFGIQGVGIGLSISYLLTLTGLLIYIYASDLGRTYQVYKDIFIFELKYFREIVWVGLPIGFMYIIEVGAFSVISFLMARFGVVTLAAQQLVMQFLSVSVNVPYALGQAVTIRMGINAGKNDKQGVINASYTGLCLSFIVILFVVALYLFFPHWLLGLDLNLQDANNFALIQKASVLLMILAVFQLFDSIRVIEVSVLRALKDTKFPMYISILSFWIIGLPLGIYLGIYRQFDGQGIWLSIVIGVMIGTIVLALRMRQMLRDMDLAKLIEIGS